MSQLNDLTGQKFGKWTVLGRLPGRDHNVIWKCRCACGNEGAIQGNSLRSGNSKQCMRCRTIGNRKS